MKRSFKLIKLVSIVSQTFLPHGGYPGLMEVCFFLIGRRNEGSIDIPPILNATKIEILKQHAWIGDIKVPKFKNLKHMESWCTKLIKKHPENIEFEKPSAFISKEEIFAQSLRGISEATGISTREIKKSTKEVRMIYK